MSGFSLREGSPDDFPALSRIDGSVANNWVLEVIRTDEQAEFGVQTRWVQTKQEDSRRRIDVGEALDELSVEWKRSDRLVIAELDGTPAGYLMLGPSWNATAEITLIIVDRQHHRQGIGGAFVSEATAYAKERGLRALQWEVQNDNRDAIEFALSQSFRIAGYHDALYHNDDLDQQRSPGFRGLALFLTKPLT